LESDIIWTVACRALVMPGATAWLYAPYQILVLSSGVWWSLLLDIRCSWRHNMTYDHICKPMFWRNLSAHTLLTRCTMCHCHEHKLPALQVRRPEQNTTLNAKTEQFITVKMSGNALKQGSRTHSVLRQDSSQLQKHQAARMSRRIAVKQWKYAPGMADTQGWQFETC